MWFVSQLMNLYYALLFISVFKTDPLKQRERQEKSIRVVVFLFKIVNVVIQHCSV